MIDRREIMASGIAVALLTRASAAAVPAAAAVTPGWPVFIADERFREARAAAFEAESRGACFRPLSADVTPVYEWLDLRLRENPATVAGITTPNALFVIEHLAWDRGLRTVYHGIHRHAAKPRHELFGSPALVERIGTLAARDWGAALGHVLAGAAPGPDDYHHLVTSQRLPEHNDGSLVSWLLAPRDVLRRQDAQAGARS